MLRTSNQLLGQAMHFLKVNHSFLVFGEHQRVLAEAHNNMGCLENKRGNLETALKHLLSAVDIEAKMEWEVGHAATLINTCSTLSLLDKHDEALEAAKYAVDMLVARDRNWDQKAADPDSEEGELMPVAFNNLALELEFAGERQQAQQAYEYAVMLATRRWGDSDLRTVAIKETAWEADQALTLGQFRVRKKLKAPPKSSAEERRRVVRGTSKMHNLDPKTRALLAATGAKGVAVPKKSELASIYAETNNPIHRAADVLPGFHSPRFWATKDGMAPRRASSFNKDLKQIGLEMARTGGAQQFPNSIQKTPWGESRVVWEDLPSADLSKIDGSIMSRTRVFSDVCGNTALEAANKILRQRQLQTKKFPRDVAVYSKAIDLRDSLRSSLHSLPELR
jgi:tetratricopeptide (TPR) repeat protein